MARSECELHVVRNGIGKLMATFFFPSFFVGCFFTFCSTSSLYVDCGRLQ
jgi:hypothetical protein